MRSLDRWARFSRVPQKVCEGAAWIYYPKYFMLPRVSDGIQGHAIYYGVRALIEQLHQEREFDVILCHWLYPDGTAAARLSRHLDIPLVLAGLGCDVNLATTKPVQRSQIGSALAVCDAVRTSGGDG